MDNDGTKKELVGRTYAGVDGYCPLAVYLRQLGYCLELALRPGVQHSASESEYTFERALPMAASLVATPLLVRADSGFCSAKLMQAITAQAAALQRKIAFIIKWNPRSTPVEAIAAKRGLEPSTQWMSARAGKRECLWQEGLELEGVGSTRNPARHIYRLTERTIDKHGHALLLPEYVLEG
jgi:Transposase DDE domain group 1